MTENHDDKTPKGLIRKADYSWDFSNFMPRPKDEESGAGKILRSFSPRVPVKPVAPKEVYFSDEEGRGIFMYGAKNVDVSKVPFDPIIPGGGSVFQKQNVTSAGKALEERVLDCAKQVEIMIGQVFPSAAFKREYYGATGVKTSPVGDLARVEAIAISDWSFKSIDYTALTMIIEPRSMRAVYQVSNGGAVIAYGVVSTRRDGKLVVHEIKKLGV